MGMKAPIVLLFIFAEFFTLSPLARGEWLPLRATLVDTAGEPVEVHSVREGVRLQVFCFLGCECPLAKLYATRLSELSDEFSRQGVRVIGINSNLQDSLADIADFVENQRIAFPMLKDHDQIVLKSLKAQRTPEVIVLDERGQEVYRGRIDDQYAPGISRSKPSSHDLRRAIEEHLSGSPVSVRRTDSVGCLITHRREPAESSDVTFCDQVARILQTHCVECHRPGEIGPFSLLEYDEVVGWADMMLETIASHRMPPWHANPQHGDFINARNFPAADLDLLRRWVAAGTPFGDRRRLPETKTFEEASDAKAAPSLVTKTDDSWSIAMADEPFSIAAEGTIEYQYFVVDPHFEEDRWVYEAQLIPSNRSVVHHGIVFVRPPDGVPLKGIGWLTAYVPGQVLQTSPRYRARHVPAGSKLVFQMHYTPTGKEETDRSILRLRFANPDEVTEEHISLASLNQALEIPARAANVPVQSELDDLPREGLLLAMSPHMHLRGKAVRVEAHRGSNVETLLDVPHYDFNWQHTYILRKPIPIESIDRLSFTAHFDNSAENPFNPDPDAFVTWGDQTWEEMAIVFYEVAVPRNAHRPRSVAEPRKSQKANEKEEPSTRHRKQAERLMADLDRNRDGSIVYDEVDEAVQFRSFHWYDLNSDRIIDLSEAIEAMRRMNR